MNPKLKMRAEIESKLKQKYDRLLAEAIEAEKKKFAHLLAEAHADYTRMRGIGMQMSHDAAIMAIDDVFDVNEYSAKRFHEKHIHYVDEIARMTVVEDKDDPNMEWTKDTVDRRLRQIVGKDNFTAWEERYGGEDDK